MKWGITLLARFPTPIDPNVILSLGATELPRPSTDAGTINGTLNAVDAARKRRREIDPDFLDMVALLGFKPSLHSTILEGVIRGVKGAALRGFSVIVRCESL
jgi:hypothetical protein